MVRLLILVLAVALVSGVAYVSLKETMQTNSVEALIDPEKKIAPAGRGESDKSAPKQQIEYYQQKAKTIEQDTQRRVDELYKHGQPQ